MTVLTIPPEVAAAGAKKLFTLAATANRDAMTEDRKEDMAGMAELLAKFTPAAEAAAKEALTKKTIPQDTLLPLLDAPWTNWRRIWRAIPGRLVRTT